MHKGKIKYLYAQNECITLLIGYILECIYSHSLQKLIFYSFLSLLWENISSLCF